MELHLTDMGCHDMGSHRFTCHPTQVNTPHLLNPSQTGWYLIYLPRSDGRLSWPRWPVTYWDGLSAHRRSPHPSTNPTVHGRELNSWPVDHKFSGKWLLNTQYMHAK